MKFKLLFFDAAAVQRSMDPVKRAALSRAGAAVRKRAQYSIRRRKGPSRPGQPPHKHMKPSPLTKHLLYAWDPDSESVVVGPLQFGEGGAPALEYGGTTTIRTKRGRSRRSVRATVKARPFMGPAKKEVEPQMAGFWAQAAVKQRGRG